MKNFYFTYLGQKYRIGITKSENGSNYNHFCHVFKLGSELPECGWSVKESDIIRWELIYKAIDSLDEIELRKRI